MIGNGTPAAPAEAAGTILPAPPQMRELDFLLGTHRCDYIPPPIEKPATVWMTVHKALGGHYYYNSVVFVPGDIHALLVYGWNPVDQTFVGQYHDTWGTTGAVNSPGWQDGHLVFTGSVNQVAAPSATGVAAGVRLALQDDYTIVGDGQFTLVQTFTLPDGTSYQGRYECHRSDDDAATRGDPNH